MRRQRLQESQGWIIDEHKFDDGVVVGSVEHTQLFDVRNEAVWSSMLRVVVYAWIAERSEGIENPQGKLLEKLQTYSTQAA